MNKNLLRVIVYGGYMLVVVGLWPLLDQIIPGQMEIIKFVVMFLILFLSSLATRPILKKYGAEITVTSPKAKAILWIVLIFCFFMLLFGPYLFFNGKLPF